VAWQRKEKHEFWSFCLKRGAASRLARLLLTRLVLWQEGTRPEQGCAPAGGHCGCTLLKAKAYPACLKEALTINL